MAGRNFAAVHPGAEIPSSPTTVLSIKAPDDQDVFVQSVSASFNGTATDGSQVLFEVVRFDGTGDGAGTTNNPTKMDPNDGDLRTTGLHTHTGEPTVGTVIYSQYIHPQGGHHWQGNFRLRQGETLGLRLTGSSGDDFEADIRGSE